MTNTKSGERILIANIYFALLLTSLLAFCCSPIKKNIETEKKECYLLEEISINIDSYIDKKVVMTGYFQGYEGRKCIFPEGFSDEPVSSRSDWVFSDGKYCVYVTGRPNSHFNPMTNEKIQTELTAYLRKSKDGLIFMQLVSLKKQQTN